MQKTPTSNILTSKLIIDEHGIYELEDKKIAVNLLNEKESDIDKKSSIMEQDKKEFKSGTGTKKKEVDFEVYLLTLVLLIILIEIFYIKQRGDL